MNYRDKIPTNPAPIRNPGGPLKSQTMPPSARGIKRSQRLKELRFERTFWKSAKKELLNAPTTGTLHRERRALRG